MDPSCLEYKLTREEHEHFNELGYLVVPDVLDDEHVKVLTEGADLLHERAVAGGVDPAAPWYSWEAPLLGGLFYDLLDWPRTFPKVWGLLGWNISIYHTHLFVTPPAPADIEYAQLHFHQDSGRPNQELDGGSPRSRLSLKVSYFLSDCSEPGYGNTWLVPGSHLRDTLDVPEAGKPAGAIPVLAKPGDALFFDRRTWHAASVNSSPVTRKVMTYGYGYRWIARRDDVDLKPLIDPSDPIKAQLLGAGGDKSKYEPTDETVPLRVWLRAHDPAAAA